MQFKIWNQDFSETHWCIWIPHLPWTDEVLIYMERRCLKIEESDSSINSNPLEIFRRLAWHEVKYNSSSVDEKVNSCRAKRPSINPPEKQFFVVVDYHPEITFLETLNRISLQGWNPRSHPTLLPLSVSCSLRTLKFLNLNDLRSQQRN